MRLAIAPLLFLASALIAQTNGFIPSPDAVRWHRFPKFTNVVMLPLSVPSVEIDQSSLRIERAKEYVERAGAKPHSNIGIRRVDAQREYRSLDPAFPEEWMLRLWDRVLPPTNSAPATNTAHAGSLRFRK